MNGFLKALDGRAVLKGDEIWVTHKSKLQAFYFMQSKCKVYLHCMQGRRIEFWHAHHRRDQCSWPWWKSFPIMRAKTDAPAPSLLHCQWTLSAWKSLIQYSMPSSKVLTSMRYLCNQKRIRIWKIICLQRTLQYFQVSFAHNVACQCFLLAEVIVQVWLMAMPLT